MTTPLEKAIDQVQANLTADRCVEYDNQSWEIFVGNQMQVILDAAEPGRCPERCGGIVGHPGHHQTSDYEEIKTKALAEVRAAWKTPPRSDESNEDWEARRDTLVDTLLAELKS